MKKWQKVQIESLIKKKKEVEKNERYFIGSNECSINLIYSVST